jgi:DNA-binding NarL/FixJ family response regulator
MRVVIADDALLFREGLARILHELDFEVVGQADNADDLLRRVAGLHPDVAIVDIRMPPTYTDEGLQAARAIAERHAGLGVVVLSQYIESDYAMRLLREGGPARGYLLKDRVGDLRAFADAIRRVGAGDSVVDPAVVRALVGGETAPTLVDELTLREREILALMAEGRSNAGIGERLSLSQRTVESHIRAIFFKLGLEPADDDHRRVLAVLAYLRDDLAR